MISDFFEPLILMDKQLTPDGLGGFNSTLEEAKTFYGAITTNNTTEMRIAEQKGLKTIYTLTTTIEDGLNYNAIIKRKKDGKLYRVTSDYLDNCTPKMSNLNFAQASLEGLQNG